MSRRIRSVIALVGLLIGLDPGAAIGQVNGVPVVSGVFPPGATIGSTVEWSISGRNLSKARSLLVTGGGLEVLDLAVKGETSVVAKVRVRVDAQPGIRELRLEGSTGISNLVLVRLDRLVQLVEVEPNDDPAKAQEVSVGVVVAGTLKSLDLDHYRIKGKPGQRLTIDLEARRIGTSFSPVVSVFSLTGAALAQGRESRASDRDCRMSLVLPAGGACVVQVRDNVYGGNDLAYYRLRISTTPFATGLFPLGGSKGQTIEVELAGGNLPEPRRKSIALPESPGSLIDPGEFDGPDGAVGSQSLLVVGDGPEMIEPRGRASASVIEMASGMTVNGRLEQPGEVDVYRLKVKTGEKIRFRVQAASLGSWLDSVLTLLDEKRSPIAENDDSDNPLPGGQSRTVNGLGVPEASPDSSIDFEAKADGEVTVELADRFGDGGPEYGYRLSIGPARPDFAVTLLLGNANANAQAISNLGQVRNPRTSPGQFGVFNLKPGSTTPVNFLVTPEGRPGSVDIHVDGLPSGVTAEPVRVRLAGPPPPGSNTGMPTDGLAVADFLELKVSPHAQPGLGEIRIVATSRLPGLGIARDASATIGVNSSVLSGRPITRLMTRFPLRILGEPRRLFVGPPSPVVLRKVEVPGPLLQGDRLDLILDFRGHINEDEGSTVETTADMGGLETRTVISARTELADDSESSNVTVQVMASISARPGSHPVQVRYTPPGGSPTLREVTIEVKAPIEIRAAADSIFLRPGGDATFNVEVRRETGFDGEVEVRLEGLPPGVKQSKAVTFGPGVTSREVRLEMSGDAMAIGKPVALRVVGMARMPRGNVPIESKIRPMIQTRPADK